MSGDLEAVAKHVSDQRLSLMTKMYSALVLVILKTLSGACIGSLTGGSRCQFSLVFWLSVGSKVTSGLCCFPLGALCFSLSSFCLPGAFRTASISGSSGGRCRLRADILILVDCSLQLLVFQAAQLSGGRPGTQRPLLVSLAIRVGAELAESLRVFPTDVTVMPGAVPAACGERTQMTRRQNLA